MNKNVLVFLSEILSAKTLFPVVKALKRDPSIDVQVVNDGFCIEFIRSLNLPFEHINVAFAHAIVPHIEQADLILMGKSYEQSSEYDILKIAHNLDKPVMLAVPDMGIDVVRAKLRGIGGEGEPPVPMLLVADIRTRESLIQDGIPAHKLIETGNPYFDELYASLDENVLEQAPQGIAYFSTPFELDFKRNILPADYKQIDLVNDIRSVCEQKALRLIGKRHPQVEPRVFEGMEVVEGAPLDLLRRVQVSVGSYSTTLLESFTVGIPTISYQPWAANIRADVFDGRIPIAKSREELGAMIELALIRPRSYVPGGNVLTFNPGRSLDVYIDLARSILLGPQLSVGKRSIERPIERL